MHETRAAIEEARQLLGRNPEDPAIQYRLGVLLSGRPYKSAREQGRRLLWGLAIGSGTRGSFSDIGTSNSNLLLIGRFEF